MTYPEVRQSNAAVRRQSSDSRRGGQYQQYPLSQYRTEMQPSQTNEQRGQQLSTGLGFFSIGLGLALLLTPTSVAPLIGVEDNITNRLVMRAVGLREIVAGIGILTQSRPIGWIRARIMGDLMDLLLLARAAASPNAQPEKTAVAIGSVLGITGLGVLSSNWLSQGQPARRIHVEQSITVNRPLEEVYQFWHDFQNLPRFMSHLESVEPLGEGRYHWKVKAPAGMKVEWDAMIVDDQPNELIAWRSVADADVQNSGLVRFTPAPKGKSTEIRVRMHYEPPLGKLGAAFAKMFGEAPDLQIADELRAFKQVMETGEVVRSEGAVPGKRLVHRPAQPQGSLPGDSGS